MGFRPARSQCRGVIRRRLPILLPSVIIPVDSPLLPKWRAANAVAARSRPNLAPSLAKAPDDGEHFLRRRAAKKPFRIARNGRF
jgi:hypothetical protein